MPVWLWIIIIIAACLAVALVILLLSVVTIQMHAVKRGKNEQISLDMKIAFGLVKLHYEVPQVKFDNLKKGFAVSSTSSNNLEKKQGDSDNPKDEYVGKEKVEGWFQNYKKILNATTGLKSWLTRTMKHVNITSTSWSTHFALEEADHTAIASGLLWSIKSMLVGKMSFKVRFKAPPKLSVTPLFGRTPFFATEMNCIAQISLGYAMYAGLTLIVRVLKVKGGFQQWLNTLFKA